METLNTEPGDPRARAPHTMQALVLERYGQFAVRDVPAPGIAPDEVLVEVKACGICGSDVHGMDGSTGRRQPPIVMGHEAAGVVVATGSKVTEWQRGDRVTFDSTVSCGACAFCLAGAVNLCDRREVIGVSCDEYRRDGAFAEYIALPARILYRLPEEIPFAEATMVETLAVAVHAVEHLGDVTGRTVVVVGTGMVGLLVVQALRARGCERVLAFDLDESRLQMAQSFGAEPLAITPADVPEVVRSLTGGRGADGAVEVVGRSGSIRTALGALRRGGRLVLVGNLSPTVEMPLQDIVSRELSVVGSAASAGEYPQCIELIRSRKVDVQALISAVAPLHEGPRWFERLHRGEPGLLKVVLTPSERGSASGETPA